MGGAGCPRRHCVATPIGSLPAAVRPPTLPKMAGVAAPFTPATASPRKCIVIGNGPSLRGLDLTRLSAVDTIGMNAAYRYWTRIGWFPTHYACLDDELIETHHLEIARLVDQGLVRSAFLSGQFLFHHPEAAKDSRFVFLDEFIPYWFERRGRQFELQDRTTEVAFQSSRMSKLTTGSHAVRYAVWCGYTDIALIGIDLRYVERIPESVVGDGIGLSIARTPDHNPNYFFDDYQRAGDRFNVPNPDSHGGDLHLASFRALRDDLVANATPVRVVNANRESELARQAVFPFQDLHAFLGARPLGAVVVPAVASAGDQIVANLALWAQPDAAPMLWPRPAKPDIIFSFNNQETAAALEPAISDAFAALRLDRYFKTLRFERLDLVGEADLYQRDYTKPAGPGGHKAGPNNQFFETMRRVRDVGRYVFFMEPDCVPIRSDWLGQLIDRLEGEDAWIIGSVYRGRGTLDRRFMRHLNGNAIYAVGDPAFQEFLADLERRLAALLAEDPRYAYDLALEILFTGASCEARATEDERSLWRYFQAIAHRFQPTDFIQNIAARIDIEEPDPSLLDTVRAESPGTYVIHNSILARTLTGLS
jgi:hypothetical protein